jgi:hypothetical protein
MDPTRVVDGCMSTLDAAVREGQVEIARLLRGLTGE